MSLKRRTKVILIIVVIFVAFVVIFPFFMDREKVDLTPGIRSRLPGSFIQLEEGYVHYELTASQSGPLVVLVSGFPSTYRLWDKTLEHLTAAGRRVLRYDLFGAGSSDRPQAVYNRQFFENQLAKLLEKLEITEPVDLVGHSLGGAIAAGFTASHPDMVNKLVLIAPLHQEVDISPLDVPYIGEYFGIVALIFFLSEEAEDYFYDPGFFQQWKSIFSEQFQYKGFRRACLSTLRNFISQDQLSVYQAVGQTAKPTLLIWGDSDTIHPIDGGIERLKGILGAQLLSIEKACHAAHYERADQVNPVLTEFLSE